MISYVSRMDEDRALVARQLVQIAKDLDRAVPGIQLIITGGGNVFDEIKAQADQVNADLGRTCVVMTGPRTDINEIVAAGDLFVGVSRSALEAMSAAKPVIVAGNEGYQGLFGPDKLEEAQAGNFCCRGLPMSTPERLREDVLAALALPPEKKAELGEYGRQVIFDFYSVRRMAGDCLKVYDQVRRRRYNVVMSGYYGFSNAGDDAILQSIQEGIVAASEDISITVLSNDPALTERLYGLDAVPRFQVWKVLRALRRCDALLSGGGSLLQDRTSTRSLLYYLSIIRLAERFHKPVMLYANGIGPVSRPANRRRVKKAVERAALVTLRDRSSAKELQDMGVSRSDLYVTADPVFNLPPAPEKRGQELLETARLPQGVPFAAVSVRDWPGRGVSPAAGRPVRPPAPGLRHGDSVSDDAARPRPGCHPAGAPGHGGALLSVGGVLHPSGADGGAGTGPAVCGHAPAHPDFCRPDGGALPGAGVRPQGGELPPGTGAALRRPCGAL